MTCLKLAGTEHEEMEKLTILQRFGSRASRQDFNRVVGIGSREQHFEFDDNIISFSSFSVMCKKHTIYLITDKLHSIHQTYIFDKYFSLFLGNSEMK